MTIVIGMQGGLGNQMFQYACGRWLSLKLNRPFLLDIHKLCEVPAPGITPRYYSLDVFKAEPNIICLAPESRAQIPTFNEENFLFNPGLFPTLQNVPPTQPVYLNGYWHTDKYFGDIRNELLNDFVVVESHRQEVQGFAQQLKGVTSVCVHIRRGDYISNPTAQAFHGVPGVAYVDRAIEILKSKVQDPHFVIFSDDIAWCREHLSHLQPATFMDSSSEGRKSALHLYFMSCCRHYIVANSSFSWWGAWLGQQEDSVVIAPSQWFLNEQVDTSDMVPSSWIRI